MSFYIIDPSLRDYGGHHFEFDDGIGAAARSTGESVTIFAHKDCTVEDANGAKVIPWFSHHIYEDRKTIIGYRVSNFLYFNSSFYRDLERLHKTFRFQPGDTILFPTISENQLFGFFRWAERFKSSKAPSLIVYLMFSPDFWLSHDEDVSTERVATERALFYKLAFASAVTVRTPVRMFAGSRHIAREFSALAKLPIDVHPMPLSLSPPRLATGDLERPTTLIYAGGAKRDKGFLFLADLADRLSTEHPNHQFMIHVDFGGLADTQADMCSAFKELKALDMRRKNILIKTGVLNREEYLAFFKQADCFICTYDPASYARKTSGVLWEAISFGLPVLVPENTHIQREAAEWGTGFSTYGTWSAAGISQAYTAFIKNIGELTDASRDASKRFRAMNNSAALVDHLSRSDTATPPSSFCNPMNHLKNSRSYLLLAWLHFRIGQKLHHTGQDL